MGRFFAWPGHDQAVAAEEEDEERSAYDTLARHLKALGSGTRLEILHALRIPHTVGQIQARPSIRREGARRSRSLSRQGVTHHLQELLASGFVARAQLADQGDGTTTYVIDRQMLFALVDEIRSLARLKAPSSSLVSAETMAGPAADVASLPKPPRLVVVYGPEEGIAYPLPANISETLVVGRSEDAPIRIDHDPYLSAEHCRLGASGNAPYEVTDLASRNGTLVNFAPLQPNRPCPLHAGDVLTVGRTHMVLQV